MIIIHYSFIKMFDLIFLFLDIDWLNAINLLDMLDNGVILCRLAKTIECLAQDSILMGHYKGVR